MTNAQDPNTLSEMEIEAKFSGGQVAKNASRSLLGQLTPMIVAFISLPLLHNRLGIDRFGILLLAWAVMGYFNVFDLGLGRTLTKNIAERLGSEKHRDIPELFWTTVLATTVLGILGGITLAVMTPWLATHAFKMPAALEIETLNSLYIIAACIPFVITTVPFRGVLEATQDFITINKIQVPIGALFYLSPLLFSYISNSLTFVVLALVLCRFASWLFFLIAALKALPGHDGKIKFKFDLLPALLRYGGWITVANIVKPILNQADRFMIGIFISSSAVAYYGIPYEVTSRMWVMPWAIMSAIFPVFAFQARNAPDKAGVTFDRAFKFIFVLLFPIAIFILILSRESLLVWMGIEYADNSSQVFKILAFATLLNCLSLVPEALLEAWGHPEVPGLLHLVQLPIYITALYFVLPKYGLIGAGVVWIVHTSTDTLLLTYFSQRLVSSIRIRWIKVVQASALVSITFLLFYFISFPPSFRLIFTVTFLALYPSVVWARFFSAEERAFVINFFIQRYRSVTVPKRPRAKARIEEIGIAMAVYRPNIAYFAEQLLSIVNQDFTNWICVITVDSNLAELKETAGLRQFFNDPRFQWFQNKERKGFKRNFEAATHLVSALDVDAIAFADQDDIWYSHKLSTLARELEKLPAGSLVHSDMDLLEDGKRGRTAWTTEPRNVSDSLFVQLLVNNVVTGAAALFDVELAQKYGQIPIEFDFHDQWFAIAASLVGEIRGVDQPLHAYRQHGANVVGSKAYDGMFKIPRRLSPLKALSSAGLGWQKVARRFYSLRQSELGGFIPSSSVGFASSSLKGGIEFLFYALLYSKDNPVLAREFFRKGVGKILSRRDTYLTRKLGDKRKINRIGIALAAYRPDLVFFYQQLVSIRDQTFTDWFCVIGCDSDMAILKELTQFKPFTEDSRFIWVQHAFNKGAKKNFEFTIAECARRGCDAIACSDQDDVWYPQKLQVSRDALQSCPPLSLVHSDMHILLSNGATVEHYNDQNIRKLIENESSTVWVQERRGIQNVNPAHFLIRNVVAGAGMLMDVDLVRMYPQIPDEIPYHDYWYAVVAAAHGGVYPIARALYQYRIHGGNLAGVTPFKSLFSYTESIRQQGVWKKVAEAYRFSRGNLAAAVREQIPLGRLNQVVIGSRFDLGLGYLIWGFQHLKDDPAFARACFARAVGKWASFLV